MTTEENLSAGVKPRAMDDGYLQRLTARVARRAEDYLNEPTARRLTALKRANTDWQRRFDALKGATA